MPDFVPNVNPYVVREFLGMAGPVRTIKCRKHPNYSPRVRLPKCQWCLALYHMTKAGKLDQ